MACDDTMFEIDGEGSDALMQQLRYVAFLGIGGKDVGVLEFCGITKYVRNIPSDCHHTPSNSFNSSCHL